MKKIDSRLYSILFTGILCVSTGSIFARIADASSLVIAAYRVGLAGFLLLPFALVFSRDEFRKLKISDWVLGFTAGAFLALHFYFWITSLEFTTVAASVVLVTTNPIWVGILSPLFGEKINLMTASGIIISFSGALIIGWNDLLSGGQALFGDLLALAGAICMTGYLLTGRFIRKKVSLLPYVTLCYGSAGLFLWIAVLFSGLPFRGFSISTWVTLPAMAIIPQIIGHTAYNWSLKYVSAPMVAVTLLGEPVFSPLMAWFFLEESLTLPVFAGALVIMTGIFFAARGEQSLRRENI